MAKAGYSIVTGGAVALSAATAKTILGAKSHANSSLDLQKFEVAFDGVTASALPVLVEVCAATFATNGPGTNSSSVTPALLYGRSTTVGWTAAKTWTTEPTVLTVVEEFLLTPNGGLLVYNWPLGQTIDTPLGEGLVIRCTAPAAVNVRATMVFERS
jgi:hypothetical protein